MTASVGFAEITTAVLVEGIIAEIKDQYLADDTPWIIGFSGGKDSTTLVQLDLLFVARITGRERQTAQKNQRTRRAKDHQLPEEICRVQGVPVEPVEQLLQTEKDQSGVMRRNNLFKDIDMALKNYLKRQKSENLALCI